MKDSKKKYISKIAICIPTYENVQMFERLLNSISMQTYVNYHIVVTDDSKTNNIRTVVEKFENLPISYYKNAITLGSSSNTVNAMKKANLLNIDYIKIMHQDDFFTDEDSLAAFVDILDRNPDAEMCFCSADYMICGDEKTFRRNNQISIEELKDDYRNIFLGNCIGGPSAVLVRNNGIFPDERFEWEIDIEWYYRLLKKNPSVIYSEKPLVSIGVGNHQVTNSCLIDRRLQFNERVLFYTKHHELQEVSFKKSHDEMNRAYSRYLTYMTNIEYASACQNQLYIYGAGKIAKECAECLQFENIDFKGFIVSSISDDNHTYMQKPVCLLEEISQNINIVVALNSKNKNEVIPVLNAKGYKYIVW